VLDLDLFPGVSFLPRGVIDSGLKENENRAAQKSGILMIRGHINFLYTLSSEKALRFVKNVIFPCFSGCKIFQIAGIKLGKTCWP
jgi:hypothetical protein